MPFDPKALEALVAMELKNNPPAIEAPAPADRKKGVSKWAQLATLGGHMADAGTTIHALNSNPNAMESNPIYGKHPSAGKILGIKGGTAALQMLMQHMIGKSSPKAANIMGVGTGAALGGVAASNFSKAKPK